MALQRPSDGVARLKRVVLIGDHHQLPPVVQHLALAQYARLDQSLFARFVRLGTPYVELNAQVSTVCLWKWGLGLARGQGRLQTPAVSLGHVKYFRV